MINKGNKVAQLREAELEHLEQLLAAVRHAGVNSLNFTPVEPLTEVPSGQTFAGNGHVPLSFTQPPDSTSINTQWDAMFGLEPVTANHEQILELAEQFGDEDLESASFLTSETIGSKKVAFQLTGLY